MIISLSGKIGSGKDTVATMIRIITDNPHFTNEAVINFSNRFLYTGTWEIKKWADKLKDIVCILLNCTREQLEDREFKESTLGEEWIRYAYATGFTEDNKGNKSMLSEQCDKEKYEYERRVNWQTAYKFEHTPRTLLQLMGTECGRDIIHKDIWVNALMSGYIPENITNFYGSPSRVDTYSKWIISDTRFPNEIEAVKQRGGILVNIIRPEYENEDIHISDTALDDFNDYSYIIENSGDLNDLVDKVREFINKFNIK